MFDSRNGSHADIENDLNNDSSSTLRHLKYQEAFWETQKGTLPSLIHAQDRIYISH